MLLILEFFDTLFIKFYLKIFLTSTIQFYVKCLILILIISNL